MVGYSFLAYTVYFYLGIAGLAPQASNSFATAQKSNQKRPPRQLRPCKKHRGTHWTVAVIMLRQNSQKTLKQLAQKTHDNSHGSKAC